jgi:glutathione S-transferase
MTVSNLPVLYSFRRCPYAMRARLALAAAGHTVELREVVLRDKPAAMLEASPKGTVPVLVQPDGSVLEESLDIIQWSLDTAGAQSIAAKWSLDESFGEGALRELVAESDGPFKAALDAYKYPDRYPDREPEEAREAGSRFIARLDAILAGKQYLTGGSFSAGDAAILPFVRQFAHVDQEWFYDQDWHEVIRWLDAFKASERFSVIMSKYKKWEPGDEPVLFGAGA